MSEHSFIDYNPPRLPEGDMRRRADEFFELMSQRRSVRHFSSQEVPRKLIERAIETASTAPSGAHRQPWRFVVIGDAEIKRQIRVAAEEEERIAYEGGGMPQEWLDALAPFGTNWEKPFLEVAPWIVVVFEEIYGTYPDGSRRKNYYVKESVGMACGLFIAAIHNMGLASLTHTPSPMAFLSRILDRPANEKPYVLIPIGYPADDASVPLLKRKMVNDVAIWL